MDAWWSSIYKILSFEILLRIVLNHSVKNLVVLKPHHYDITCSFHTWIPKLQVGLFLWFFLSFFFDEYVYINFALKMVTKNINFTLFGLKYYVNSWGTWVSRWEASHVFLHFFHTVLYDIIEYPNVYKVLNLFRPFSQT